LDKENTAEFRFLLELEGERRISATDLFELLEKIMVLGSISRASSSMGLSYRYAWGLIREAERTLEIALVEKQVGGYAGGGTTLTKIGKELLKQYRDFKLEVSSGLERFSSSFPSPNEPEPPEKESLTEDGVRHLLLASTMEPIETGLLDLLEQAFFKMSGILVRHIALGSGRALQIAKEGRVDMVLTHAPEMEKAFMAEGWGKERISLMTNAFVLCGPRSDPAGLLKLRPESDVVEALQQIAKLQAPFISRNDQSGTHLKELELWKTTGINPQGNWYVKASGVAGNLGTLRLAREKEAYTLVDHASFMISGAKGKMKIYSGNKNSARERELLENIFSLILVSPELVPGVQYEDSSTFARWLKGKESSEIISNFGRDNFNEPFFALFSSKTAAH
jgi:tungstate transport system substrate-binding protein